MSETDEPVLPTAILLVGVSGSGKTTVGAMLAGRLGGAFADADDFHSAASVAKMRRGIPLDDADRGPWLAALSAQIERWRAAGAHGVIACSALKRRYRDRLVGGRADVQLVYLHGEREVIARRLAARHDHFMPTELLESQLQALEVPAPDEGAIVVSVAQSPDEAVAAIVRALPTRR